MALNAGGVSSSGEDVLFLHLLRLVYECSIPHDPDDYVDHNADDTASGKDLIHAFERLIIELHVDAGDIGLVEEGEDDERKGAKNAVYRDVK